MAIFKRFKTNVEERKNIKRESSKGKIVINKNNCEKRILESELE